jgi:hypothetical protein
MNCLLTVQLAFLTPDWQKIWLLSRWKPKMADVDIKNDSVPGLLFHTNPFLQGDCFAAAGNKRDGKKQ